MLFTFKSWFDFKPTIEEVEEAVDAVYLREEMAKITDDSMADILINEFIQDYLDAEEDSVQTSSSHNR